MHFLQKQRISRSIFLVVTICAVTFITDSLLALPYGRGGFGSCQYSTCSISLTGSGAVNLGITPKNSGSVHTTVKDTITVSTNSSTGYTLSFRDADTSTNIVNLISSIPTSASTPSSPTTLPVNRWGYRVDGLLGFGPGPTVAQSNATSSTYTFAGVPASTQTAHVLRSTTSAANPNQVTDVWYGVRADKTKPLGTYTNQVVYTAVVNN